MNKSYKETWGDIVKDASQFDAIVHGCNCFHIYAKGIAGQIRRIYPEAYEADLKTKKGDKNKLGTFSVGICKLTGFDKPKKLSVINTYTQYHPGADVFYSAIESAMQKINIEFAGRKIAVPMIGAGIAGGDWSTIKLIILKSLKDVNLTLIYWDVEKEKYNGKFPE